MKKSQIFCFLGLNFIFGQLSYACDNCSIYTPLEAEEIIIGQTAASISVDLLGYSKAKLDGEDYLEGANQNLKTTVAELGVQHNFSNSFGLQVVLPFVEQKYKRLVNGTFDNGSESGLGDVALYGRIALYQSVSTHDSFIMQFIPGIKFPTGDSKSLKEAGDPVLSESSISGADITLGTGSFDYPMALSVSAGINDFVLGSTIQYILRSEGDEDYQIGDDLRWSAWFGRKFDFSEDSIFEPRIRVSGLTRDKDEYNSVEVTNSGLSIIYAGPEISLSFANDVSIGLLGEFPVSYDNDGLQQLPDHRVRLELKANL